MPEHQSMEHLVIGGAPEDLDIFEAQRGLQRRVYAEHGGRWVPDRRAITEGELLDRIREQKEAIDNEHAEILDLLPWKSWKRETVLRRGRPLSNADRREIKFELIDQLHFLLNEMIAAGFDSWDEVVQMYYAKNRENLRRQDTGY